MSKRTRLFFVTDVHGDWSFDNGTSHLNERYKKTGAVASESCIPTSQYLNELGKREIKMTKSEIDL